MKTNVPDDLFVDNNGDLVVKGRGTYRIDICYTSKWGSAVDASTQVYEGIRVVQNGHVVGITNEFRVCFCDQKIFIFLFFYLFICQSYTNSQVTASLFVFLTSANASGGATFEIQLGIKTRAGTTVTKSFDNVGIPSNTPLSSQLNDAGTRTNLLVIITGTKTCLFKFHKHNCF